MDAAVCLAESAGPAVAFDGAAFVTRTHYMNFHAMLRVKDEARWIERVIRSLQPLCPRIFVFDDHSTDGTPEICESLGAKVYRSTFEGVNETRDKNWLLERIWKEVNPLHRGPDSQDTIVCIDGDEELEAEGVDRIRTAMSNQQCYALALRIVYLWDTEEQIRTDGIYGKFTRGSVFRMISPMHSFKSTRGANFHCGNTPQELLSRVNINAARLLHYGYLHKEDRIRKYQWYQNLDPDNKWEDNYRHMVIGDLPEFPADIKLMHAGPLTLEPLEVGCRLVA